NSFKRSAYFFTTFFLTVFAERCENRNSDCQHKCYRKLEISVEKLIEYASSNQKRCKNSPDRERSVHQREYDVENECADAVFLGLWFFGLLRLLRRVKL